MSWMEILPPVYDGNLTMEELQNIVDDELSEVLGGFQEITDECFINTALSLLSRYEQICGLEVDVSKSSSFRRERIKAKVTGIGTVTKQMIIDTAASYSNGEVEVLEDVQNNRFIIKFVGVLGIPENMSDLILTIEQIKPAHLGYTFEYTWISWNQYESYHNTWEGWDFLNLTWDEFERYKEAS